MNTSFLVKDAFLNVIVENGTDIFEYWVYVANSIDDVISGVGCPKQTMLGNLFENADLWLRYVMCCYPILSIVSFDDTINIEKAQILMLQKISSLNHVIWRTNDRTKIAIIKIVEKLWVAIRSYRRQKLLD
jgi:hypothetical protein